MFCSLLFCQLQYALLLSVPYFCKIRWLRRAIYYQKYSKISLSNAFSTLGCYSDYWLVTKHYGQRLLGGTKNAFCWRIHASHSWKRSTKAITSTVTIRLSARGAYLGTSRRAFIRGRVLFRYICGAIISFLRKNRTFKTKF